ncbi:MAG: hypothetical protein ABSG53_31070 [Thermoguttaceae bacterium]|jgi:hypothetical protein
MGPYRFELAGPDDDADLRAVLARTSMPGAISVAFRREPSYFAAAVVDGRFRQVIAARDEQTQRIVGFGSRSVGMRYVNGHPAAVGYLSSLRILERHRSAGLLARGYAFLRKLHEDGRSPFYLTTIAEENQAALAVLTAGRAGLPTYHFAGRFYTAALRLAGPLRSPDRSPSIQVRKGRSDDLPTVLEFLHRVGPRRQFFPCYELQDFENAQGALRDLRAEDLLLAYQDGCLVGTLGGWDQHAFRQMLVHDYAGLIRWSRPLYNVWASVRGLPRLPRPDEPVRCLTAALLLVSDEAPRVFRGLLNAMIRSKRCGRWQNLLVGMHESDPLLASLREYTAAWYTTNLYLACWQDGDEPRRSIDERPIYLELGSL